MHGEGAFNAGLVGHGCLYSRPVRSISEGHTFIINILKTDSGLARRVFADIESAARRWFVIGMYCDCTYNDIAGGCPEDHNRFQVGEILRVATVLFDPSTQLLRKNREYSVVNLQQILHCVGCEVRAFVCPMDHEVLRQQYSYAKRVSGQWV